MFRVFSQFGEISRLCASSGSAPACTPYFGHAYTSSLGGHPTFARSSVGSYLDSSDGLVKTALANIPRYQSGGLLFEISAATNIYPYSIDTTSMTFNSCGAVTGKDSPSGDTDAYAVIVNAATHTVYVYKNSSVTSGSQYVFSVYAKSYGYNFLQLNGSSGFPTTDFQNFNLSTGELGNSMGGDDTGMIDIGNGWYRCYFVLTATSSTSSGRFIMSILNADINSRNPSYAGDGVSGLVFWGPQLEVGAYPTSYIETVDATPVTRAAETLSYSGINATNETRASVDIFDGNGFQNVDVDNWDGKVDSNIITGSASPAIVQSIVAYPTGCRPA
jgi:hypothetical protein